MTPIIDKAVAYQARSRILAAAGLVQRRGKQTPRPLRRPAPLGIERDPTQDLTVAVAQGLAQSQRVADADGHTGRGQGMATTTGIADQHDRASPDCRHQYLRADKPEAALGRGGSDDVALSRGGSVAIARAR